MVEGGLVKSILFRVVSLISSSAWLVTGMHTPNYSRSIASLPYCTVLEVLVPGARGWQIQTSRLWEASTTHVSHKPLWTMMASCQCQMAVHYIIGDRSAGTWKPAARSGVAREQQSNQLTQLCTCHSTQTVLITSFDDNDFNIHPLSALKSLVPARVHTLSL